MTTKLTLSKPLVFIKVRTTGRTPGKDKIFEISVIKMFPDGTHKIAERVINPLVILTDDFFKYNTDITPEEIKNAKTFTDISLNLFSFINDSDLAGFNLSNYDLKFLIEEFASAGIEFTILNKKIVDLSKIYNKMEPRDFKSAVRFYCNEEVEMSNLDCITSTKFSINILNSMLDNYSGVVYKSGRNEYPIQNDVVSLYDAFYDNKNALDLEGNILLNADKKAVLNKGKYTGSLISDLIKTDESYLTWVVEQSKLPADTKIIIKKIIEKSKQQVA